MNARARCNARTTQTSEKRLGYTVMISVFGIKDFKVLNTYYCILMFFVYIVYRIFGDLIELLKSS